MRLTVIIPTLARCEAVTRAVESLGRSDPWPELEVVVADNGTDPALAHRLEEVAGTSHLTVRYLPVPAIGLHNGRHAGARAARGEVLAFIDDDVLVGPQWLKAIAAAFEDPEVALVGGPSAPAWSGPEPSWAGGLWQPADGRGRHLGLLSLLDLGERAGEVDPVLVWGLNFAIRRDLLTELGGFNPDGFPWALRRFRGDGEVGLTSTLRERGLRAVYQPRAMVQHTIPEERARVEYLVRRSTLQGISDSYTSIRAARRVLPPDRTGFLVVMADGVRQAAHGLRSAGPDPIRGVCLAVLRWRLRWAWRRGVAYHQRQVAREPRLLEWVLRSDYWDASVADYGG